MSLTDIVNNKIKKAFKGIDKSKQLQSVTDPELIFRRNSINLYVGRRGSGKTFNVLRELIKLSNLKGYGGYNSFIYCTDKTNDDTVNELLSMVKLKTRIVSYKDMPVFLADLVDAKMAYSELLEKGLLNDATDKCKEDLMNALDLSYWGESMSGTVILYDDAINIFKNSKNKKLLDLLFQNRQPRITYFLCLQDPFSLPAQIKRNLDTAIIFGGYFDKMMMSALLSQLNSSNQSNQNILKIYNSLSSHEGLIFDYLPTRTDIKILEE
jgi:hypothetical protein